MMHKVTRAIKLEEDLGEELEKDDGLGNDSDIDDDKDDEWIHF